MSSTGLNVDPYVEVNVHISAITCSAAERVPWLRVFVQPLPRSDTYMGSPLCKAYRLFDRITSMLNGSEKECSAEVSIERWFSSSGVPRTSSRRNFFRV